MNQLKLASLGFALAAASGCAQEAEPFADSSSTGSGAPDGLLSYRFQREVKVIGPVVPGYSLSFTIDHASLVTAGKARDDGNDVRLAFQKDGAPVELHRVIDPSSQWDATNTLLWFRTPDEGPPPSTYTLYYGHEAPEPPLADPGKVYDLWEDFSGGVDSTW
jgi:hypothetical protein